MAEAKGSVERGFVAEFDHVALALERATDAWPILAEALGGRFLDGGQEPGYSWTDLRFANGFTIETLHPEELPEGGDPHTPSDPDRLDHRGDFVRRFLAVRGPGVHHFTFMVDDLSAAMASMERSGIPLGFEQRTDPIWEEALYGPDVAHGVMLQVVQRRDHGPELSAAPEGFPELGYDHPVAAFGRAVHAVADLEGAVGLFRDALGGEITSTGSAVDGNHWVEIGWQGPGRLRLLEAAHAEIAEFVGELPGRVRHLYFTFDDPGAVPGARSVASGRWVVDGDDALGVRVVVSSALR